MSEDLDAIQAIFFEECAEGLAAAEGGLTALADGSRDPQVIAAVFRAVHSIKGGSGAFGHDALLGFSHRFENVLDALRSGHLAPTEPLLQLLLQSSDMLADHVAAARDGGAPPADHALAAQLDHWMHEGPVAQAPVHHHDEFGFAPVPVSLDDFDAASTVSDPEEQARWQILFRPSAAALSNGGEALLLIREIERLGGEVVSCDASALPPLRDLAVDGAFLSWTLSAPGGVEEVDLRECFDFVDQDTLVEIEREGAAALPPSMDEEADFVFVPIEAPDLILAPVDLPSAAPVSEAPAAPDAPAPRSQADRSEMTIRVDLAKLDGLLNLVGELVIRNSILADRLGTAEQEKVELPQLSRLTRSIQDTVMGLRAQPIRQAFSRVPRLLRELESETGKKVQLLVSGEATEVDKRVIERIGDPLTHMIRNAVDHGIEPADKRLAGGKPAAGTIRLSAEQRGGRIIVRVEDDGGGIDRDAVRNRAIERGLVAADALLTDEEIDQLICAPGFSTAAAVSNISGRGVGMDVVRSNIESLGGRLEIGSQPGIGTSFTLILPLTLAILDGMVVRLGGQRFVLPLQSVVESVRPESGQVSAPTPGCEVIELRGSYLPLRRLDEFFGIRGAEQKAENGLVIVVESDSAGQVGLFVDTVDDRREVVIKSLDKNLHPIRGLGGATVLGDGSIALILDVDAIVAAAPAARPTRDLAA